MSRQAVIHLIVSHPKSEAGRAELARRVAQVHVDAVLTRIRQLNCPSSQKMQLLDAIIADVRGND